MSKLVTWIIVIVIVLGGVWYFLDRSQATQSPDTTQSQSQAQQGSSSTASSDTSDQALQQDAASIDTQLQTASTDTNAAGSFNDTPVQQTE